MQRDTGDFVFKTPLPTLQYLKRKKHGYYISSDRQWWSIHLMDGKVYHGFLDEMQAIKVLGEMKAKRLNRMVYKTQKTNSLIQKIKWWWRGLCPRHGTVYEYRKWEQKRICPTCWNENHNQGRLPKQKE